MQEKTDRELVALARQGDKEAFGILTDRYLLPARRLAKRLVSRDDLAQDLAQEAILQAYLSLDRLRDPDRFKSWLYGIVLNVCRSHIRNRDVKAFSLEAVMEGWQQFAVPLFDVPLSPEKLAEERELHGIMVDIINSLPSRDRDATLLFYYAQLSLQEIALLQDISLGAVKVRLHRARQRLKEKLQSQHPELIPREKRRKKMIKVTIADVVKQEREGLPPQYAQYVVILRDEAGKRALPIWVGAHEGTSIAMGLTDFATPRPMTYNTLLSLLQSINAGVEQVRIETLKETTFYAIIKIRCGKKVSEIDARPSDAINLAVLTGSPVVVAEDVMARGGTAIPAGAEISPERKGVESILEEIDEMQRKALEELKSYALTPESVEKAKEELIAAVFGK